MHFTRLILALSVMLAPFDSLNRVRAEASETENDEQRVTKPQGEC